MEGVEVNGVLSCSSGGKVSFWIDCDVGVVIFISKVCTYGDTLVVALRVLLYENSARGKHSDQLSC